jgi:hypothetical protein
VTATPTALEEFRTVVLADPSLQEELRRAPDRASFVALVIACAGERGCVLEAREIEAALDAGARTWTMQRIEP